MDCAHSMNGSGTCSHHNAAVICQGLKWSIWYLKYSILVLYLSIQSLYIQACLFIAVMHNHVIFNDTDAATQFSNCTDNAIRLVGGISSNQGRLEVCMNSAWGSVCDSAGVFTSDEAKVVCKQLGILQVEGSNCLPLGAFHFLLIPYSFFCVNHNAVLSDGVEVMQASQFGGESSGPIFMDQFHCTGDEESLSECDMYTEPGMHMCGHQNDVGVICQCKKICFVQEVLEIICSFPVTH